MKTLGVKIILSDAVNINPSMADCSEFVDEEGSIIVIPNKLVLRIHAALETEAERREFSFRNWVRELFA